MNGPYTIYCQKVVRMLDDAYETRNRLDFLGQHRLSLSEYSQKRVDNAKTYNECLISELNDLYIDFLEDSKAR
jgi:hypothetical protein